MAKAPKFTFKKHPRSTGLAAGEIHVMVDIKYAGHVVGGIYPPDRWGDRKNWKIQLMVITPATPNDPAGWRNVMLKYNGASEQDCRDFLNNNIVEIFEKFTLRLAD